MAFEETALDPISREIWDLKYRFKSPDSTPLDREIGDTWKRVAAALAEPEAADRRDSWAARFEEVMADYRFLPAGRILAGAGTKRQVTLFNCFVMGTIEDDLGCIFDGLKEAALTMQQGGGIGHDFSSLRPRGAPVKGVGADASGPLSFMDVWDAMCRTIMSAGSRRGAMMATMRCDHPDIEDFITAKHEAARLRMFNLSVLISDTFMQAVKQKADWPLVFDGRVFKTVPAHDLWEKIMRATYDYAEPGVLFIDRINAANNLNYCETICATNPCGEQPLPPYGACLLGSVNLAAFIDDAFGDAARFNEKALVETVKVAVRMLDNVIEVSNFPLPQQAAEARAKRRLGLGVTGLADALVMLCLRYGSEAAAAQTSKIMALIETTAYRASIDLAGEKGAFPLFDKRAYLSMAGIHRLPVDIRAGIKKHGIRNALLTSIAPTGTISLLAGNVSSGVEPIFSYRYERQVLHEDGSRRGEIVEDYAVRAYRGKFGEGAGLPDYFTTAQEMTPRDHLIMQAALQPHVDSSISKTINCPGDISYEAFKDIYLEAYDLGLKGCTTYRPNAVTGSVLKPVAAETETAQEPLLELTAPAAPDMGSASQPGDVVYMKQPLERETTLPGFTYKLRWPETDHAIYITLNDIIQDGRRRPFEIFINSKNMEHYAWTVALTRMISAVFRRGGDVSFVVEELKAVFDPRGGQWMERKYVPSLLAAIGGVIEQHMIHTGFLQPEDKGGNGEDKLRLTADGGLPPGLRQCPKCADLSLVYQEGCDSCLACGYSKCS